MTSKAERDRLPDTLLAVALIGAISALAGGYLDDAWHTERGRDSFFIAPHIAIYLGVAAVGGAVALAVGLAVRSEGVRAVRGRPVLLLAALSVLATLASGPIDAVWHEAFGRDSVIWSPPHMLGIVGTLTLGAAILAQVGDRPLLRAVTGGLVLAAAGFVTVEYDTDVPQFAVLWYLPALSFAAAVGFVLIERTTARGRLLPAAAAHLAFVTAVAALMTGLDFSAPALPLLVIPALLLDLTRHRGAAVRGAVLAAGLFAVYVPVRTWLGDGVAFSVDDVLIGLPLAFSVAAGVFVVGGRPGGGLLPAAFILAVPAITLAQPDGAAAHDPGQGRDAGTMALEARSTSGRVVLRGRVDGSCEEFRSGQVVARRAGRGVRAPLAFSGCRFIGTVRVGERGRWFVYAELREGTGRVTEAWLPVPVGDGASTVRDGARYAYAPVGGSSTPVQFVAGAALYGTMLVLLLTTFRLLAPRSRSAGRPLAGPP